MYDSLDVARAAISLAISPNREEEEKLIKELADKEIQGVAIDIGGDIIKATHLVIERAIFAARKAGIITKEELAQDGAVAGAAREAQSQVISKAMGLNGGGKIAIARSGEHVSVCIFMSVGMMYLNEVVVGLGHRTIYMGA
ncbi:MAG: HutP family protein [Anaerovoracaceae bacterium]